MEKIFQIASNVSTPLALAGIFATIFFFIIRQILSGKDNQWKITNHIIILIINKLFILAIAAMLLGFIGWVIGNGNYSQNYKNDLKFSVYLDNRPIEGAAIFARNVEGQTYTNRDGVANLSFEKTDSVIIEIKVKTKDIEIDTLLPSLSVINFPKVIPLFTKLNFTNDKLCQLIMDGVDDYENGFSNLKGETTEKDEEYEIFTSINDNKDYKTYITNYNKKGERPAINYFIKLYEGKDLNQTLDSSNKFIYYISNCLKLDKIEDFSMGLDGKTMDGYAIFRKYNIEFRYSATGPDKFHNYHITLWVTKPQ
jgi:hypothetical protein